MSPWASLLKPMVKQRSTCGGQNIACVSLILMTEASKVHVKIEGKKIS